MCVREKGLRKDMATPRRKLRRGHRICSCGLGALDREPQSATSYYRNGEDPGTKHEQGAWLRRHRGGGRVVVHRVSKGINVDLNGRVQTQCATLGGIDYENEIHSHWKDHLEVAPGPGLNISAITSISKPVGRSIVRVIASGIGRDKRVNTVVGIEGCDFNVGCAGEERRREGDGPKIVRRCCVDSTGIGFSTCPVLWDTVARGPAELSRIGGRDGRCERADALCPGAQGEEQNQAGREDEINTLHRILLILNR